VRALLVSGPDLAGGDEEIRRLRPLYAEPSVLTGREATAASVLAAMERADVVHLAAHGSFRADNPMFSSLALHDGPLTVYDLESLAASPSVVVLPACDAARATVKGGDELLGAASALLQVGVTAVIAPVTVVPDAGVVQLMVELHRRLLAGRRPALALLEARRAVTGGRLTAASAFVSIGRAASGLDHQPPAEAPAG
jgi:CHAT domain-containing protein